VVGPLFRRGEIPWLQLTVDQAFVGDLPDDFVEALDAASTAGRLVGHGVSASPFTVPRDAVARAWLVRARSVLERWPVQWFTDHVGCCRASGWHAAPLPLPPSRRLVDHTADHLRWLHGELGVPVGLENLALAVSADDVVQQPDLVEAILAPVDGVLLLDLHNLWCGAVNYGLDPLAVMERWPLQRVVQLHIAGGSYDDGFRRDTHDGPVPDPVWSLLPEAIARCPNLRVVVWERLRGTVDVPDALIAELQKLAHLVAEVPAPSACLPVLPAPEPWPEVDPEAAQRSLFAAARAGDRTLLDPEVARWWRDERAWRVAVDVTEKWGRVAPR